MHVAALLCVVIALWLRENLGTLFRGLCAGAAAQYGVEGQGPKVLGRGGPSGGTAAGKDPDCANEGAMGSVWSGERLWSAVIVHDL